MRRTPAETTIHTDEQHRRDRHPFGEWIVAITPRPARPVVKLVVHTIDDALDDRIVGLSAEVAFFSILSLPPLLLTVVAGLGFLPGDQATGFVDGLVNVSTRIFTESTIQDVIEPTVRAVVSEERPDVLSIGFLLSLITASRAVRVVLTSVAIAYDLDARRPGWRQRLYGLLSTLGLLVVVPVLVPLLLTGPDIADELPAGTWVPIEVVEVWPYAYWAGIGVGAVSAIAALYHLAAPWWTPFRRDLPGAVLAVLVWVGSSAGLRTYTTRAITDDALYQYIAGPLVLLVWLYLLAFGVLLGAELNAELERLWPSPEHRRRRHAQANAVEDNERSVVAEGEGFEPPVP